ncbi:hypothetical protein CEP53_002747 [Fusarium sp. AF-6]|nr:hypothetical protein CEP53_002747 [Fusarium sp. AF-6]
MATLDSLKQALRKKATATSSTTQPLSDTQYFYGLNVMTQGSTVYEDFIVPQLTLLLAPLVNSESLLSVLEIGPGPKSVLGYLPDHLRNKVGRYSVFEPNELFAPLLEDWFTRSLPRLEKPPDISLIDFHLSNEIRDMGKFDLILFCHSMYGTTPKRDYIKHCAPTTL